MNNNIKIFENPEFGQVRVYLEEGLPVFCLMDICRTLSLDPKDVKKRLDIERIICNTITNSPVRKEYEFFLSEPVLHRLLSQFCEEKVKRFQNWVVSEVIPSIHKEGFPVLKSKLSTKSNVTQGRTVSLLEQKSQEQEKKIQDLAQDIKELERVMNEINKQLKVLTTSKDNTPERLLLTDVKELVQKYQKLTDCEYTEVWNKAFNDLYYKYAINVDSVKEIKKDESGLSKLVRKGHLEELKTVLSEMVRDGGVN